MHVQKIYFGAPGTGKSYKVDELISSSPSNQIIRVTFHPEYTYSDFVGQILPVKTSAGIDYVFKEGPFTKALVEAYNDLTKSVYLIIEELSRGNAAAIFGDIFQLLDRDDHFESRYSINNEDIASKIPTITGTAIKLPSNFNIICTVNMNDQNVFVMDTAFKRRFDWEYVGTDPVETTSGSGIFKNNPTLKYNNGTGLADITWVDLYTALNKFIAEDKYLGLGEDKQLGHFFIEFEDGATFAQNKEIIKNKLLYYLWEDVKKGSFKNDISLFKEDIGSFSNLYKKYENDEQIFSSKFIESI